MTAAELVSLGFSFNAKIKNQKASSATLPVLLHPQLGSQPHTAAGRPRGLGASPRVPRPVPGPGPAPPSLPPLPSNGPAMVMAPPAALRGTGRAGSGAVGEGSGGRGSAEVSSLLVG